MNSSRVGDLPVYVSSKLGQKGRLEAHRPGDKAADKSALLLSTLWEFRPISDLFPFLCGHTVFYLHPAWSDCLTEGQPQERHWAPVP